MKKRKTVLQVLSEENARLAAAVSGLEKELTKVKVGTGPAELEGALLDAVRGREEKYCLLAGRIDKACQKASKALDGCRRTMLSVLTTYGMLMKAVEGAGATLMRAAEPEGDAFVSELYDAMRNVSVRKWTREHLDVVRKAVLERDEAARKAEKLAVRASALRPDGKPTPEARAAEALKARQLAARDAASARAKFALWKFLDLRACVLRTLAGTTEMMYSAAGDSADPERIAASGTSGAFAEIEAADRRAEAALRKASRDRRRR